MISYVRVRDFFLMGEITWKRNAFYRN